MLWVYFDNFCNHKDPHYYNVVVYEAIIVKGPFTAAIFGLLLILEPNFDQIQDFEHGLLRLSYSKNWIGSKWFWSKAYLP